MEAIAAQSPKDLSYLIEQISGSLDYRADYDKLRDQKELATDNSTLVFNKKRSYHVNVKEYENEKSKMDLYNKKVKELDDTVQSRVLWKLFHLENDMSNEKLSLTKAQQIVKQDQTNLTKAEIALENANSDYAQANKNLQKLSRQQKKQQKSLEEQNTNYLPVEEKIKITQKHYNTLNNRLEEVKSDYERQNNVVSKLKRDLDIVDKAAAKFEQEAEKELQTFKLGKITASQIEEYNNLKEQLNLKTVTEQSTLESIARQKKTFEDKLSSLKSKQEVGVRNRERLKRELDGLKSQLNFISSTINENNEALNDKKLELNKITVEKQNRSRKEADLNARLQEVTRSLLDYNADLRTSEKERKLRDDVAALKRIIPGVKGLVYDLCKPKQRKYETAVATVLGRDFDSVVVDSFKVAQQCINYMKEQRSGVATFIPLDTVVVKPINSGLRGLDDRARLAIDTVDYDSANERAVQYVCSDSLICDNLQVAKDIRWQKKVRTKVVTLDGAVIHKSNLMSGGRAENNNAQKWESSKVRGLQLLKDKLLRELQDLAKTKRSFGPLEETLTGEIFALETKLGQSRQKMSSIRVSIEGHEAELKNAVKLTKELTPVIEELNKSLDQLNNEIEAIESSMLELKNEIFKDFCQSLGVNNIKEYEVAHSNSVDILDQKRLQFTTQRSRLENQLKFENERVRETNRRVDSIKANVHQDLQLLEQLKSEKAIIEENISLIKKDIADIQAKIDARANTVDAKLRTVTSCRTNVTEANKAVEKSRRIVNTLSSNIERFQTSRFNLLRNCKLESIELPLLEGSLENIPLEEVVARTGTLAGDGEEEEDNDGDISMTDQDLEYGIIVDYQSLDEKLKQNSDDAVDDDLSDRISTLNAELNQMVVDVRAEERLDDATEKYHEIEKESEEARKLARETVKNFNVIRDKRIHLFMEAYNHISGHIDAIYKELTKSKTFPVGGSAYLSLGDEAEPYLDGISYHAMPPMKRFCDMELLSGGEKTMAALALLFAIHSYHPSPFFILDEVDAALDNANVSNIARYIKTHSISGSQFIVISLKNGLFENSNSLVGIYRDQNINSSKALTMDLSQYSN